MRHAPSFRSASTKSIDKNRKRVLEAVRGFKQGLETTMQMVSRQWHLKVYFKGTKAYTDGRCIYLPNVDILARPGMTHEEVDEALAYLMALRGFAWHEVAHLVESDLPWANRFVTTHGRYAHHMWNAMEDIRIEKRFQNRGTGIKEALEYVRESWVWQGMRFDLDEGKAQGSYLGGAMICMQIMAKHGDDAEDHPLWRAFPGVARDFARRHRALVQTTRESFTMSKQDGGSQHVGEGVLHYLEECRRDYAELPPVYVEPKDAPGTAIVTVLDDAAKYAKALAADPSLAKSLETLGLKDASERPYVRGKQVLGVLSLVRPKALGTQSSAPGSTPAPGSAPAPTPAPSGPWKEPKLGPRIPGTKRILLTCPPTAAEIAAQQEMELLIFIAISSRLGAALEEALGALVSSARRDFEANPYDGGPYLVFTNENDIFETVKEAKPEKLQDMRKETEPLYGAIKTRLAMLLRSRTRSRWRGNREEGDQLDPAAMADIAVAHKFPGRDLRPYRDRVEKHELLSTSVGLLVDTSASMMDEKMELAERCCLAFADCLDMAQMEFAVWGFTSNDRPWGYRLPQELPPDERNMYGRFGGLHVKTVKTFDDSWKSVEKRLPNLGAHMESNYDADSVEWACHQLMARRHAKRRVLFVLSDGMPLAAEHPIQIGRQQQRLRDIVPAMREAGIEIVGVGILDESVEQFYKPHCVVVRSLSDLTPIVMSQMEFLLLRGA